MKIAICHFSPLGEALEGKMLRCLTRLQGQEVLWSRRGDEGLAQWTREHFSSEDALIFIGASGICVRAIAPYVKDKLRDPAVLLMDDQSRYVIPLLSGHMG